MSDVKNQAQQQQGEQAQQQGQQASMQQQQAQQGQVQPVLTQQIPGQTLKEWAYNNRKPLMGVIALVAVLILIVGLSLTWFVTNKSLSTVGKIQTPAQLKVLGPNQTAVEQMSLSYSEAMKDTIDVDNDGTATIRRGFCVQSDGSPFELQIANTTNISGLRIKVYRVADANAAPEDATIAGFSGTATYSWQKGEEVTGFTFINEMPGSESSYQDGSKSDPLAKELEANDPTFELYKNVQQNARPLYRYRVFPQAELYQSGDAQGVATNFIIECQWKTKPNVKETDVVYLIARSA